MDWNNWKQSNQTRGDFKRRRRTCDALLKAGRREGKGNALKCERQIHCEAEKKEKKRAIDELTRHESVRRLMS